MGINMREKMTNITGIKIRFSLVFILFVAILFSVIIFNSVQQIQKTASVISSTAGMPMLNRASAFIDGDKYELLAQTLDAQDPFFIETQAKFRELREENQCLYIYTMARTKDNVHYFIFDGEDSKSKTFSPLGSVEDVADFGKELTLTYETKKPQFTPMMVQTKWGRLVTAYAPILNSNGDVVGVLGVDFDGEEVYQTIMLSMRNQLAFAVIFIIAGLFVCFFFFKDIARISLDEHKALETANRYAMEKKLAENRISMMLSQIQPHFLYNALAVISRLCDKDPAEAKKATINFSNYLRSNMNLLEHPEPIPFENELNHTIGFLNLEKAMYGDALKVIYDIQTKNFKIPALTVQPIAENAVKHGIGKKEGGGTITISAKETEGFYFVIIADDGPGFATKKNVDDGEQHIGISNVRLRLSLQCGGSLEIKSNLGEGTTATLIIPKNDSQKKV
ncbi:hypothetical protein R83H12_00190 [Fibrobacteria bacterium R8-3-H12]